MSNDVDIALMGVFRSGTNYLRTIMENNFRCRLINNAFGWKHGYYPVLGADSGITLRDMPLIVVVKRPSLALYSLHRYYTTTNRNIAASSYEINQFLRGRITIFHEQNPFSPQYRFSNPVQMWNALNWNYASICSEGQSVFIQRYEDLLATPETAARAIAERLHLEPKTPDGSIWIPANCTKNMGEQKRTQVSDYVTDKPFLKRDFYLDGGYMKEFGASDIQFIRDEVDQELMEKLGYDAL